MWASFSSAGTWDILKDLFTIVTIISASPRAHDFSSQVGMGQVCKTYQVNILLCL